MVKARALEGSYVLAGRASRKCHSDTVGAQNRLDHTHVRRLSDHQVLGHLSSAGIARGHSVELRLVPFTRNGTSSQTKFGNSVHFSSTACKPGSPFPALMSRFLDMLWSVVNQMLDIVQPCVSAFSTGRV